MLIKNFKILILGLLGLIIISIIVNLNTGFLSLNLEDFINGNSLHQEIINLRINRILAGILAGLAIPTSGFLLQEYFRNPLAGPSVLGITSVASLSVAFFILFSKNLSLPEWLNHSLLSTSAIIGSFVILILLLIFSDKFQEHSYIIIFGFLISALAGAIISILQFYAENEALKSYILWSFGGNNQLTLSQIIFLFGIIFIGLLLTFKSIKPLIGMSLGVDYARTMGINLRTSKLLIITASSLLSASVTAFLGPILFIGIIVPHFCRMIWKPALLWHQWMLNMLLGILIMEIFSILSEIFQLPLNTITSLFGVPVILFMILNRKHKKTP